MKNPLLRFSLLLILLFGTTHEIGAKPEASKTAPDASKTQKCAAQKPGFAGLKLLQTSALLGDCDVLVAKDRLRMKLDRMKLVVYAQGPKWQVLTVNPGYKTVWSSSPDNFSLTHQMTKNLYLYGLPSAAKLPVQKTDKTKDLNGLKCRIYATEPKYTTEQLEQLRKQSVSKMFPRAGQLYSLESPLVSAKVSEILSKIYDIPCRPGLPVQLSYQRLELRQTDMKALETLKWKEVQLTDGDFAVPQGLTSVKDFSSLDKNTSTQYSFDIMDAFSEKDLKPAAKTGH